MAWRLDRGCCSLQKSISLSVEPHPPSTGQAASAVLMAGQDLSLPHSTQEQETVEERISFTSTRTEVDMVVAREDSWAPEWDPMVEEASRIGLPQVQTLPSPATATKHNGGCIPAARSCQAFQCSLGRPSMTAPVMETVAFHTPLPASPIAGDVQVDNLQATVGPSATPQHVNTMRGASPGSMHTGVLPTSPGQFEATVPRRIETPVQRASPARRHPRTPQGAPQLPRRSTRLAKKTRGRASAVINAQNVLIKKLGLTPQEADIDNSSVIAYNSLFEQGLSPS